MRIPPQAENTKNKNNTIQSPCERVNGKTNVPSCLDKIVRENKNDRMRFSQKKSGKRLGIIRKPGKTAESINFHLTEDY